ncbi:MAG TPA: diguanylate cyclase [Gemmatimonadales bacterium]|nr:diguanylate cyclase [Gemmatimonadales bacterium]
MTGSLNDALAELRREYLFDAPGRLAELRKDVAAFRAGESDAALSLVQRFHRLSGSGGSYGFPEISEIARGAERWLKTELPEPGEAAAARLDEQVDRLAAAFDLAARELGLPARGPAVTEFGWRALVIGRDGALGQGVRTALVNSGFLVRTESGAGEPREVKLSERPDLIVVMQDGEAADPLAIATAWAGAGPVRPRSIVLIGRPDAIDRVRALASGIDTIIPPERVAVDLPTYAKTLARIGSPPPRVLLIESDSARADTITHWLEQANAKVTHCPDGVSAREAMVRETPDLILTDTRLPGIDGLSLARLVRQDSRFALTPIVFLTDHDTVADQIEALSAGADHFLTEPVDRELLTHLVVNRAERGRRLREMVHRDGLTGLLNHATLMAELEHAIEYARRHGESFAFLMIDVDHFKRVNDRYGHLAGDQVLLHVARVFQTTARASDLIGRYGGEEFGMILRRTDRTGAGTLAGKLRTALVEQPAVIGAGESIPIRVCIGIAAYPDDATTAAELAQLADAALYRAKAAGRDRVEFTQGMRVESA